MNDVLGAALMDYQQGLRKHKLWINNRYGKKEEMPVSTYFRTMEDMSDLESLALQCCKGNILDIGACAGSHSLILQQRKYDVTALDVSAGAGTVMQQRGVKKVITADVFKYTGVQFDTLLLLMNGIGLAGTMPGLNACLHSLKLLLKPGGQVLFDSSDIAYLYKGQQLPEHYYGEVDYQYAYRGKRTEWFKWLYADQQTMRTIAADSGFAFRLLQEDAYDQYLAQLTLV